MVIILILSNSWGGFFGNHLSLVNKYHFWKKAIKEQHMLLSTRIICHFITHLLLSHTTKKKKASKQSRNKFKTCVCGGNFSPKVMPRSQTVTSKNLLVLNLQ